MSSNTPQTKVHLNEDEIKKANDFIVKFLQNTMSDGRAELGGLRTKLSISYWVIISLSMVMFIIGIVLLSVPIAAAFRGNISGLQSLIAAGFGISDLTGLFLFRPIERIHALMGDISQVSVVLTNFNTQASLRLLEMDVNKRGTIEQAAEHINAAAKESIKLIQVYFEAERKAQKE